MPAARLFGARSSTIINQVCPKCHHHFKISATARLQLLLDDGKYQEFDKDMQSTDPLAFVDSKPYLKRLSEMSKSTGEKDAVLCAQGNLNGRPVIVCSMELKFIGGSMGAVVGEKITRAIERSIAESIPLVIVSASGGARMQEGAASLMQLAKISAGVDETG